METDPYTTPDQEESSDKKPERFSGWSTPFLVALFFFPAILFGLAFYLQARTGNDLYTKMCLYLALGSAVVVSLLSATIHTVRGNAGLGTLTLFSFVYLLAQVLSFLTMRFGIWVISGF